MDQMRVLIVTPTIKKIGGVETMNEILKNILEKHHYVVDYLTADENEESPFWVKLLSKILGRPVITGYKYRKLKKSYDIVICNGEYSLGIKHSRLINYFHGSYWGLYQSQKNILSLRYSLSLQFQSWIQYLASLDREVVAVSDYLDQVLSGQGIKTKWVINNPVDTSKFKMTIDFKKRKNYLFVGSYNYWAKGFDILEALALRGHSIHCYSASYDEGLLIAHPPVNNEELSRIYPTYRILIFPSRFEANSMAVLEALSCGVPVITTEVGIGSTLKQEIHEFVLPLEASVEDFELAMVTIENNYEHFCQKARDYATRHHHVDLYEENWLKLLSFEEKVHA